MPPPRRLGGTAITLTLFKQASLRELAGRRLTSVMPSSALTGGAQRRRCDGRQELSGAAFPLNALLVPAPTHRDVNILVFQKQVP
jgi:hypothetical protein